MSSLAMLRAYALKDPSTLSSSVLFRKSDQFFTIFDAYPKSIFHFLVMPRLTGEGGFTEQETTNLRTLLNGDKQRAKEVIEGLKREADEVKKEIEEEMVERYGFKWDVWVGFHAVPSMLHLHLHVLSADLVSERMKNKKHYNSFHPSLGFFLHIDDVLGWFDSDSTYYSRMAKLTPKPYEDLLKRDLACFKCKAGMKNVPKLKEHLQQEWDELSKKAKLITHSPTHKRKALSEMREIKSDNAEVAETSYKRAKATETAAVDTGADK